MMPLNLARARTQGGARSRTKPEHMNPPEVASRIAAEHVALVHHIARQFSSSTILHADIVGEGMVGLVEGAKRLDLTRDVKPATYLGFWIRARIFGAIQKDAGATSNGGRRAVFQMRRTIRELERTGRDVTPESIAAAIGVDVASVTQIYRRLILHDVRLDAVPESGERRSRPEALDPAMQCTTTAEDCYLGAESTAVDQRAIVEALARLPERDAAILRMRYLSEDEGRVTLQDVANHYGISRERARQLELRAITRMRRLLQDYGVTGSDQ